MLAVCTKSIARLPRRSLVETAIQYNSQSRTISPFQAFSTKTTMAKGYAKDQPKGFSNRIEKVAIIGVRRVFTPPCLSQECHL